MRYQKSLEYLERAKKVIPGAAQTLSKMPARFPQGAFPVAVKRANGARVTDLDGNEYVDWICGLGAVTLGYSYSVFGTGAMSLPHRLEVELAERLCTKIPCAEMVRFVNSGSEATEAAIRTARIATGNDLILTVKDGYHSWMSWFQSIKDWHPGVPDAYRRMIAAFKYNDLESLEKAISDSAWAFGQSHGACNGKVAAVIMEPCLFEKPMPGFLEGVCELCAKNGALLIFDEMVTGYRWALAGGQEYFNVTPDLATFGKGMANGLPIGMLCGKREYMQHAELISGTFCGNAISLAAADAVLDVYESEDVIGTMWRRGLELQQSFLEISKMLEVDHFAMADGYPCKPRMKFTMANQALNDKAMSLFLQETAEHGILLHPGGLNVCYALTDEDMRVTQTAITKGLEAIADAVRKDDWSALKGDIIKPVVTVRK